MTSVSTLGATQVVVQFDLNRNIDSAAQDVQAAISTATKTLPQSMTIPLRSGKHCSLSRAL